MVSPGQKAPDFIAPALVDGSGQHIEFVSTIRAHEAVVLLFAPADFVPACTADWRAISEAGWHYHPDIAVLGVSGDSLFSHATMADQHGIDFPIISDFHGGVADQYDLLESEWEGHKHIPTRGAVVIDGDWEIIALEQAPPLADADPAPVETAGSALRELGFDIDQPNVVYNL